MKDALHSPKWRSLTIEKTLKTLDVDSAIGVSSSEIKDRRAEHGSNQIPEPPQTSILTIWFRQFKSPLIGILLFAGAVLTLLEHTTDASVIFIVLAINSIIGTQQEYHAHKTVRALRKLTPSNAVVRRDGTIITIPATEVVWGDIIILAEGDHVVADARLIETNFLRVDESLLTGESIPVAKDAQARGGNLDALDAPMMIFAGTTITHGIGLAVVTAVGPKTKLGMVSSHVRPSRTPIPLERDLAMLSKIVIFIIALLLVVIVLLGLHTGLTLTKILFTASALAVSAIPEGLPAVLTIILSAGMWRMAKRNVLVKKLFAIEALGQVRVLALDKTGTITFNQMMVTEMWTPHGTLAITGEGYMPRGSFLINGKLVEGDALKKFAEIIARLPSVTHAKILKTGADGMATYAVSGDPTDGALVVLAEKMNLNDASAVTKSVPFDYEKKFSIGEIKHPTDGQELVIAGAPEIILNACTHLSSEERGALAAQLELLAERGLRVVALATKKTDGSTETNPRDYKFQAFFGMADVVRPGAAALVARAKGAGLHVVMITGDLPTTARAIARHVGLFERGDHILTGRELHNMPENELHALLPRVSVFARVTPEDKLRIIELYQKSGHTIAMTGDGVNDAPSLVAADLGIAMGNSGTDVARHASDILLLNDDLESIVAAIDEGRIMYISLRKVLVYLFATNFGEICIIASAFALGISIPITAAQIIWLNLVTDGFLDVALALEPKDSNDAIPRLRRTRYLLHKSDFVSIIITGIVMTLGTGFMYFQYQFMGPIERTTIILIVMAMFQWMHAWAIRTERRSFFQTSLTRNPYLIGATAIVFGLQILAVTFPPLQKLLGTTSVPPSIWFEAIAVASSLLFIEELRKMYRRAKR
ncbi:MAG: cation-transporting P-type ATPase [Candidatus Magasanikbacteria bacterium]|nr:cation-transporting P-type ATPase [Candidatus Magasanikbacteria bacterium]